MNIKEHIIPLLEKSTISIDSTLLETPQDRAMGDVALPCFQFAKELRKSPQQIAQDLSDELSTHLDEESIIEKVIATWPYVNFFVKTASLANDVLQKIKEEGEYYGMGEKTNECILIESPGPNTNKPLHLWHVRNMLLGNALWNILSFAGHDVHAIDIVNDRWVHICKSMLTYQRFGNNEQPDIKPDHYVGKRYVRFATEVKKDESLNDDAQKMLQQRESWDKDIIELRDLMRQRCIQWQHETYNRFGTSIEKAYYESDHYLKWKTIVEEWAETWLFSKNEKWHLIYTDDVLWDKIVLRSDGTSIYITQDIALWKLRYEDRSMDRMIYVVWNEQENHFQFLFSIFKTLKLPFADKCYHLSYWMVALPDGKMKSREWTVVDADDIANETHQQSYEMLQKRYPDLSEKELQRRAEIIAMGAIKFFFLKYDAIKNFVYDKNSSLRFDGETWPYIQYTYARCCGTLAKAEKTIDLSNTVEYWFFTSQEERSLLLHLNEFPLIISDSAKHYQPYLVARYVLDLAHLFNSFYQKHTIVDSGNKELSIARCALVQSTQTVLKTGLWLLGIEVLKEM